MMWDVRPFANENRLEKTFHGIKVMFKAAVALRIPYGGARAVLATLSAAETAFCGAHFGLSAAA